MADEEKTTQDVSTSTEVAAPASKRTKKPVSKEVAEAPAGATRTELSNGFAVLDY